MFYNLEIKGVKYVQFSIDRKDLGGRYSKQETIEWLKENKIKYSFSQAYTTYVGHWAILIEAKFQDKFEDFIFGR